MSSGTHKIKGGPRHASLCQAELPLIELLRAAGESDEAAQTLKGHLKIGAQISTEQWRGFAAVPPRSLLEVVCQDFAKHTNIPLELPLALLFHRVASLMSRRGVTVSLGQQRLKLIIWTILLADSCAGKSWTLARLSEGLSADVDPEIPGLRGVVSAAALFSKILENPVGGWTHDEFGQFASRLEADPSASEMKEYLLLLYDGTPLERSTVRDGSFVTKPTAVSICGMTQHATWHQMIPPRCMLDGFAARFNYLIARSDPKRPFSDFPIWNVSTERWRNMWSDCSSCIQSEYRISKEAEAYYCDTFREMADGDIPESFFRRSLFSAHRLAVCYHVLLCDPSPELTTNDYAWALRLVRLHLADARDVIGEVNMSDLQRMVVQAESIVAKCAAKGRRASARDFVANIRSLPNVSAALGLMKLLETPLGNVSTTK